MSWQSLTTRGGNRPAFKGRGRGRPRSIMPKNPKDLEQDKKIKQIQKKVRKIENYVELKHKDTFFNVVEMVSDPGVANTILLNPLSQGDTDITRDGNLVKYTSMQLKGTIFSRTANVNGAPYRIIIFWDKAVNGIAPTAAMLLDASVITNLVDAPYNNDNFPRFKIIYDTRSSINPNYLLTGLVTAMNFAKTITHREKISRTTNYGLGNTGDITDISVNSMYALFLSNATDASNLGPTFTGGIRLYFRDP